MDYFLHTGHVIVDGVKMAKSLGNGIAISEALQRNTADDLRMLCLMHRFHDRCVAGL